MKIFQLMGSFLHLIDECFGGWQVGIANHSQDTDSDILWRRWVIFWRAPLIQAMAYHVELETYFYFDIDNIKNSLPLWAHKKYCVGAIHNGESGFQVRMCAALATIFQYPLVKWRWNVLHHDHGSLTLLHVLLWYTGLPCIFGMIFNKDKIIIVLSYFCYMIIQWGIQQKKDYKNYNFLIFIISIF